MIFTDEEKLEAIESLIVKLRWARKKPGISAHRHLMVLKAIATDIRYATGAKTCEPTADWIALLDRRVDAVKSNGQEAGKMIEIAQRVIGKWGIVRRALENAELAAPDATGKE